MNREDIIRMAREAGLPSSELYHKNLERFAALVAAAEREACAKVCDTEARMWSHVDVTGRRSDQSDAAATCAAAIRARGNT